jgi:hypothetical protein
MPELAEKEEKVVVRKFEAECVRDRAQVERAVRSNGGATGWVVIEKQRKRGRRCERFIEETSLFTGVSTFLLPEGGIENSPGRGVPDGLLLPVGGSPGLA